jgi:CRP/FNR family transcriptional regulator, anaerobic regulatory protein
MNNVAVIQCSRDFEPVVDRPNQRVERAGKMSARPAVLPATASLAALFYSQPAETFAPPRMIFAEGDPAEHVFYVMEGWLRVYRIKQDGRRAIVGFVYGGDVLGVSFRGAYLFTAEAVTCVKLKRYSCRRFHALVDESPELRPQLLAKVCDEMAAAQDQMVLLGATRADERLAAFLLRIANRTGGDHRTPIEIDLPFGRVDIADYLGLTIETVCREFSKLKRNGLISMRGPHRILLRRMQSLRQIAGMDDDERFPAV